MKEFTRLTNSHNGQALYVDLETVRGVGEWVDGSGDYNPFANHHNHLNMHGTTTTTTTIYTTPHRSTVLYCDAQTFYVNEHISEVLALIEGRDPKPARILYGKKKD